MLKPVKQRKISDQIYEQIRDLIYRGEYKPGEKLIGEREMAVLFKVGRPTVRSAIQRLLDNGLIIVKRGVGTFVAEDIDSRESSPLLQILNEEEYTITEFHETRMALESKSAELAAMRADDNDLRLLNKSLRRLRQDIDIGKQNMTNDISFHMNIAYASKNIVHIQLMKSIFEVQYSVMKLAYLKLFQAIDNDEEIYQQHAAIVAAITKRDPDTAIRAMAEHMTHILENYREKGL